MALAFVRSATDYKWGVATDPFTKAFDCTGVDALFVVITTNQAQNVSGITYNGVAMTQVSAITAATQKSWVYAIASPSTGSNNIVVDFSANCSYFHFAAAGFSGADTADIVGASTTYYSNSTTSTLNGSLTTESANSWLLDFIAVGGDGDTVTPGSSQTERAYLQNQGFETYISSLAVASPGATTSNFTLNGTNDYTYSRTVVELKVATGSSGPANIKTINGLAKASVKTVNGLAMASIKTINGLN